MTMSPGPRNHRQYCKYVLSMAISSLIARRQLKLDFDHSVRRSGRRLEMLRVVALVVWCVLLATVPTPHSFLSRVVVLLCVAALFECGVYFFKRQAKPVLYRRRVLLLGMLVQLAALGLLAAFPEEGRTPVSFSNSQAENVRCGTLADRSSLPLLGGSRWV